MNRRCIVAPGIHAPTTIASTGTNLYSNDDARTVAMLRGEGNTNTQELSKDEQALLKKNIGPKRRRRLLARMARQARGD